MEALNKQVMSQMALVLLSGSTLTLVIAILVFVSYDRGAPALDNQGPEGRHVRPC